MQTKKVNNLKCLQWNCRSKNNLDYLKSFLSKNEYHVIALQSLNCKRSQLPKLEGFFYPPVIDFNVHNSKVQVATYISNLTDYTVVTSPGVSRKKPLFSCCINFELESSQLCILNCYYPDGVLRGDADWIEHLDVTKQWLIMGDFNAHHSLWQSDLVGGRQNSYLADIFTQANISLLNDGSITRIADRNDQKSSAIDLSLISPKLLLLTCWCTVNSPLGSDHLAIQVLVNSSPKINHRLQSVSKYKFTDADWNKFQNHLSSAAVTFSDDFQENDLDLIYGEIRKTIINAADGAIPKTNGNSFNSKVKCNPWWNNECKEAVKEKTRAFKVWKSSLKNHDAVLTKNLHDLYKQKNINCNRVIAFAKQEYFKKYINANIQNPSDTAKVWKEIGKMKGLYDLPQPPLQNGNVSANTNQDKADMFAEMFSKTSNSIYLEKEELSRRNDLELKHQDDLCNGESDNSSDNESFMDNNINIQELESALKAIKASKVATGKDPISYIMIKHFPHSFLKVILRFFQLCWSTGKIPSEWKEAVIVPIHKPGKIKVNPNSYRPIALTPHLGKLYERIVKNRLEYFCEKRGIIPLFQAGFRKGRCVTDHTVRLASHVKKGLARRHSTLATFYDIRKAYDSVWHFKLLAKLKTIGIDKNLLRFVRDFLKDRTIQVRVGDVLSNARSVDMGVPQGSVISPLLFSIMLHDIKVVDTNGAILSLYADDIALWKTLPFNFNKNKRKRELYVHSYQQTVNQIIFYLRENGFSLSSEKTVFVIFTRQNISFTGISASFMSINGKHIYPSKTAKFLGVIFHYKLLWHSHIVYVVDKARKKFALIKLLSGQPWANNGNNLIRIALALVRSVLSYGKEVYFSAPKSDLHKIVSIDSMALKLALGLPRWASISKTYKEAGVLPILENNLLLTSKYTIKAKSTNNSVWDVLDESITVCKQIKNKNAYKSIHDYVSPLLDEANVVISNAEEIPVHPYPPWLLETGKFWYSYCSCSKKDNANVIAAAAKELIDSRFKHYLKVYTDGSVDSNKNVGAAFVIPEFNVFKRFNLPIGCSIFSAELTAIWTSLSFLSSMPSPPSCIVILSDSKSSLMALDSGELTDRPELIKEIQFLIHQLITRGCDVQFVWVPSHTSLKGNTMADVNAKEAAKGLDCQKIDLNPSISEMYSKLVQTSWLKWQRDYSQESIGKNDWDPMLPLKLNNYFGGSISDRNLFHRLRVNAWVGRFLKPSPLCSCGDILNLHHLVMNCNSNAVHFSFLIDNLKLHNLPVSMQSILFPKDNNFLLLKQLISILKCHPVGRFF